MMTMSLIGRAFRRLAATGAAVAIAGVMVSGPAGAAGEAPAVERQDWTFAGVTGYYDRAQLQRGFQVFTEVCSACHGLDYLYYRNLSEPGGPEFSEEEVKAIAAAVEVEDGPNEDGEMFMRPAKPKDLFKSPYANEQEARAINGGALPPELSVIAKARTIPSQAAFAPAAWAWDIATGYQEAGPDYLYALLTGYTDPPDGVELASGMSYNKAFPGHQIAMPNPLFADLVEYADGSPQTVEQYAKDVSAFLMWAAEPKLEERKQMGIRVIVYLLILTVLLYLAKRYVWGRIEH